METLELSLKAARTELTGDGSPTWLSLSSYRCISLGSNVPQLLGRLSYSSLLFPIDSFVRIVPFSTLHHSTSWTVAQMDGLVDWYSNFMAKVSKKKKLKQDSSSRTSHGGTSQLFRLHSLWMCVCVHLCVCMCVCGSFLFALSILK